MCRGGGTSPGGAPSTNAETAAALSEGMRGRRVCSRVYDHRMFFAPSLDNDVGERMLEETS